MKKILIPFILLSFTAPSIALADGRADYNTHCVSCHRGSPQTNIRRAKLLNIDPDKLFLKNSKMTREEMIAVTEKGKNRMTGFEGKLTKEQITDIVDFILSAKGK